MKKLIGTFLTVLLSMVISGFFMWVGNKCVMVHNILAHFNIADLSFWQYAVGSLLMGFVISAIKPNNLGAVIEYWNKS